MKPVPNPADLIAPKRGYRHACALFAASGLTVPLVPWELRRRLREHGRWRYATRPLGASPYDIREYLAEAERYRVLDYAVLAHAGEALGPSAYTTGVHRRRILDEAAEHGVRHAAIVARVGNPGDLTAAMKGAWSLRDRR